jgi:hypothetical protein
MGNYTNFKSLIPTSITGLIVEGGNVNTTLGDDNHFNN